MTMVCCHREGEARGDPLFPIQRTNDSLETWYASHQVPKVYRFNLPPVLAHLQHAEQDPLGRTIGSAPFPNQARIQEVGLGASFASLLTLPQFSQAAHGEELVG
jgi:hypothetical protein